MRVNYHALLGDAIAIFVGIILGALVAYSLRLLVVTYPLS